MATEAAQGKRSGKYRHVYGDPAKPDHQFQEVKKPLTSGESSYVKASAKFFAIGGAGPSTVYIRKLDDYGRFGMNPARLHPEVIKGKIWDWAFNPFHDNMLAMGGDDCRIAVAQFPMEGFENSFNDTLVTLEGHSKKVCLVQFHPTASSILASASFDRCVKLWNIETGECISTYNDNGDNIYSIEWNKDGSQLAVTGKDKQLRIFDPRTIGSDSNDAVQTTEAFDGAKSSKCFWAPQLNWIGACGFSKQAKRQLKLWDLRDLSKPLYSNVIDQAASVLLPKYDDDNGLLYMAGKGDGTVSFGELVNDDKKFYSLGVYRNPDPQKGGGWVPKRALDVFKCEVQRFLKLTQKSVIPISFIVPRKAGADIFQEDIFPDCDSGKASLSADEWLSGENKEPKLMKMDPKLRTEDDSDGAAFQKKKTYAELQTENKELKARVAELEAQLGITSNDDQKEDDNGNDEQTMESAASPATDE